MGRPSLVTQWISEPNSFSANDKEELATLLSDYPYFIPARYIDAANHHKQHPFGAEMMEQMQLYMGNWLLFFEHLDACEIIPGSGETELEIIDEIPTAEQPEATTANEQSRAPETIIPSGEESEIAPAPVSIPEEPMVYAEKPEIMPSEPPKEIYHEAEVYHEEKDTSAKDEPLIKPLFSEDYFLSQGIEIPEQPAIEPQTEEPKSLMVVMSFSEWLMHFKMKNEKERQEQEDKKALKSMWQKKKLAAALEEENEEIPEAVFNMAVNSITKEEDLVSESLAEILHKQGKYDKALDMYRKLSLRNPQKNAYFARKIEEIIKQIES